MKKPTSYFFFFALLLACKGPQSSSAALEGEATEAGVEEQTCTLDSSAAPIASEGDVTGEGLFLADQTLAESRIGSRTIESSFGIGFLFGELRMQGKLDESLTQNVSATLRAPNLNCVAPDGRVALQQNLVVQCKLSSTAAIVTTSSVSVSAQARYRIVSAGGGMTDSDQNSISSSYTMYYPEEADGGGGFMPIRQLFPNEAGDSVAASAITAACVSAFSGDRIAAGTTQAQNGLRNRDLSIVGGTANTAFTIPGRGGWSGFGTREEAQSACGPGKRLAGHRAAKSYAEFAYPNGMPRFSFYGCFWDATSATEFRSFRDGDSKDGSPSSTTQGWFDGSNSEYACYALCTDLNLD